jgi:hypothetical protein
MAVESLGWRVGRWAGDIVECLDAEGESRTVGLENLYRRARAADRAAWPEVIADFLHALATTTQDAVEPSDLNAVAERILVRIGPPFSAELQRAVWSRPLGDSGLIAHLVLDHAETMSYVTGDMVASSGKPGEDWLAWALENLRKRTPADCFEVVDEDSGLLLCGAGDAYDAARSLILDILLPESKPHGTFLAVPNRDTLLVLPVTARAISQVHLLKVLADKHHPKAPYPISTGVFWVRGGEWRTLPITVTGKEISVHPPPELVECLNALLGEA